MDVRRTKGARLPDVSNEAAHKGRFGGGAGRPVGSPRHLSGGLRDGDVLRRRPESGVAGLLVGVSRLAQQRVDLLFGDGGGGGDGDGGLVHADTQS